MNRMAEEGALVYALDKDYEGLQACLSGFTVTELTELLNALALVEGFADRLLRAKRRDRV